MAMKLYSTYELQFYEVCAIREGVLPHLGIPRDFRGDNPRF